ncbi:MAG: RNA recognition motif domain-containing protein [Chthoniobacterales bacterium]
MNSKLYVGNLTFETTESDLSTLFSQAGAVRETTLITDKMTGRSRGFAFVVMSDEAGANAAIEKFNDKDFGGRNLTVNIAREREERPAGGARERRPARNY